MGRAVTPLIGASRFKLLLSNGYRGIALNSRGHGQSSSHVEPTYSPQTMAIDATALLNYVKTETAYILGHSLGALVASELAIRRPELVQGLVIIDPQDILENITKSLIKYGRIYRHMRVL